METIPDYYINIQIAILNTKIYICMEGGGGGDYFIGKIVVFNATVLL